MTLLAECRLHPLADRAVQCGNCLCHPGVFHVEGSVMILEMTADTQSSDQVVYEGL